MHLQGQGCWQGPARSLTVHAVCGSVNQILEVSEPEKCEYVATMATPAECTESVLQQMRDELKLYIMDASAADGKDIKDEL
jgi:protein kinase C substrate 80K-H